MFKRAALVFLLLCGASPQLQALALGDVELRSQLSQQLDARIPLIGLQPADLEGMNVGLADAAQFRRAGIDRPFLLTSIRFEVVESEQGAYISLSTRDPVNEPFLNFLLELDWPSGQLVREYTMLLDPPVYGAALRAAGRGVDSAEAASVPGRLPSPPAAGRSSGDSYGPVGGTDTLWTIATRTRADASVSVQQMMLAILRANPQAFTLDNVNTLRAGSVLRIPARDEVLAQQADEAVAVVRQHNAVWQEVRQILAAGGALPPGSGAPLAVPGAAAPAAPVAPIGAAPSGDQPPSTGQTPAASDAGGGEVRISAGASALDGEGTASQGSVTQLESRLDSALEELSQLRSQFEDVDGRLTEADALLADMNRVLAVRDDQLAQLQARLAEAEAALQRRDAEALAGTGSPSQPAGGELASSVGGAVQSGQPDAGTQAPADAGPGPDLPPVTGGVDPEAAAAGTSPAAAGTTPPADAGTTSATPPADADTSPATSATGAGTTPAASPADAGTPPAAPPPAPPRSLLDEILAYSPVDPLLLGGGAIAIVVLLALAALLRRRRRGAVETEERPARGLEEVMLSGELEDEKTRFDTDDRTEMPVRAPAEPDPDATMQGPARTLRAEQLAQEDDPLQEANVYLAYERFDQAEKVVRSAIDAHPERHEYKLKLLEVLHAAGNRAAFLAALPLLAAAVGDDHEHMQQANAMLAGLPEGDAAGTAADTGVELAAPGSSDTVDAGLDFDLGFDSPDVERVGADSSVDFDLGFDTETVDGGVTDGHGSRTALDFDLSDDGDPGDGRPGSGSVIDFDLGEADPLAASRDRGPASAAPAGMDTEVLDFDLAFGGGQTEDGRSDGRHADGRDTDDGRTRQGGEAASGTASGAGSPAAPEGGPGDDNSLDFDLSFLSEPDAAGGAAKAAAPASETGDDMSLDFDLGFMEERDDAATGPETASGVGGSADQARPAGSTAEGPSVSDLDLDFGTPDSSRFEQTFDTVEIAVPDFDTDGAPPSLESLDLGRHDPGGSPAEAGSQEDSLDFDPGESDAEVPGLSLVLDENLGDGRPAVEDEEVTQSNPVAAARVRRAEPGASSGDGDDDESGPSTELLLDAAADPAGGESTGDGQGDDGLGLDPGLAIGSMDPSSSSERDDDDAGDTARTELLLQPAYGGDDEPLTLDFGVDEETPSRAEPEDDLGIDLEESLTFADDESAGAVDLSFDTGDQSAHRPPRQDEAPAGEDAGLDFDFGGFDPLGDRASGSDDATLVGEAGGSLEDAAGAPATVDADTIDVSRLDFPLEGEGDAAASTSSGAGTDEDDLAGLDLDFQLDEDDDGKTQLGVGGAAGATVDAMQTRLDLAREYIAMGDAETAREILDEVDTEGNAAQQATARDLRDQLG